MNYNNILAQLEPYKDKAFYLPMVEKEIKAFEEKIGKSFPDYFKEFLLIFGIKQDFIYELLNREIDFIAEYEYLPKKLKKEFIPIGGSQGGGNGDTWLLKSSKNQDKYVYEFEHDGNGKATTLDFTFEDLIIRNIQELIQLYDKKPFNKDKNWCVQFSIKTNEEQLLLKVLEAELIKDWGDTEVYTSGVISKKAEMIIGTKNFKFSKSEYKDWQTPSYYFNLREPANTISENCLIKQFDKKLNAVFKGYKLIDYGIMALKSDD